MDELCTVCPFFNADFCHVQTTFYWVDDDGSIVTDSDGDHVVHE